MASSTSIFDDYDSEFYSLFSDFATQTSHTSPSSQMGQPLSYSTSTVEHESQPLSMPPAQPQPKRALTSEADQDEKPTKRPRRAMNRRTCVICDINRAVNQFPNQRRMSAHSHPNDACRACFRSHMEQQIEAMTDGEIACPICDEKLTPKEIEYILSSEAYRKCVHAVFPPVPHFLTTDALIVAGTKEVPSDAPSVRRLNTPPASPQLVPRARSTLAAQTTPSSPVRAAR